VYERFDSNSFITEVLVHQAITCTTLVDCSAVNEYFSNQSRFGVYFFYQLKVLVSTKPIGFALDLRFTLSKASSKCISGLVKGRDLEAVNACPAQFYSRLFRHVDQKPADTCGFHLPGQPRQFDSRLPAPRVPRFRQPSDKNSHRNRHPRPSQTPHVNSK
jgi:hypothetical protein